VPRVIGVFDARRDRSERRRETEGRGSRAELRPARDVEQVKRVPEELLAVLKREKLVLDCRKEQQTRAAVRVTVEETLDQLPEKYTRQIYAQKCDAVYQHVFDSYWDDGHSAYDVAA
jgi:type I restriction enzyme R subunit